MNFGWYASNSFQNWPTELNTPFKHLVVIGGGAAGMFCAVNAARLAPSLKVTVLEKTSKLLSKVRVSGGGRCNLTHACFSIADMLSAYPRGSQLLKKAFTRFFTTDTIAWFESRGVALKTEADGRIFPVSNSSQSVIDCLMAEAARYQVAVHTLQEVLTITYSTKGFDLHIKGNTTSMMADFVCVACGGLPQPERFDWLRSLGHTAAHPVPSLFTFNMPLHPITELTGLSVPLVQSRIAGLRHVQTGPLLITHWGMSGPAILRLSAWAARDLYEKQYQFTLLVNWLGKEDEQSLRNRWDMLRQQQGKLKNQNPFPLPQRLWHFVLEASGIDLETRWAELPGKAQQKLISNLCGQAFEVSGKTTFKEEFVTAGGISLPEIDPLTMQSRIIPRLFFAGEVMDVDGMTGGFNFQHAWTSAYLAAQEITRQFEQG
jgi:predicted Rossmann fold flavoprotein